MTRVLLICTGNICRSPTAHAVLDRMVRDAGLQDRICVDSAGTQDYHAGESPDRRAQLHAARRGYDLSNLRARQIVPEDFVKHDLILAMDRGHMRHLALACPAGEAHKLHLFLEYAGESTRREVPDPYYGGSEGFERVLDLVESGARGLLARMRSAARTDSQLDC